MKKSNSFLSYRPNAYQMYQLFCLWAVDIGRSSIVTPTLNHQKPKTRKSIKHIAYCGVPNIGHQFNEKDQTINSSVCLNCSDKYMTNHSLDLGYKISSDDFSLIFFLFEKREDAYTILFKHSITITLPLLIYYALQWPFGFLEFSLFVCT